MRVDTIITANPLDLMLKTGKTYSTICVTDDNENSILFSKDYTIDCIKSEFEHIDYVNESHAKGGSDFNYCSDMNCTVDEYIHTLNNLIEVISGWTEDTIVEIVKNAPRFKNGNIKSNSPVYFTGCISDCGYGRKASTEISLLSTVPLVSTDPNSVFYYLSDTKKNTFAIVFNCRKTYKKTDQCIFNMILSRSAATPKGETNG